MGAPTSPALSNLSSISFDTTMTQWAELHNFVYTRFVDDLSISSKTSFNPISVKNEVQTICRDFELQLNESKTKFYNASQTKKVTGLLIDDPVSIPKEFYDELETDLLRLKHLNEVYQLTGEGTKSAMVKLFKQQVYGQVNFIAQIEGYQSEEYVKYEAMFEKANTISVEKLYARWTNFNYF